MLQKLVTLWLACLFLTSSTLLPLSDFALMQDLPNMYRNYTNMTTPEELGVIDFIGDYLLHGKEIFGNNSQDKAQTNHNGVQFQHQANPLQAVFTVSFLVLMLILVAKPEHAVAKQAFFTSSFSNKLFRPPLA